MDSGQRKCKWAGDFDFYTHQRGYFISLTTEEIGRLVVAIPRYPGAVLPAPLDHPKINHWVDYAGSDVPTRFVNQGVWIKLTLAEVIDKLNKFDGQLSTSIIAGEQNG